ncbi:MAG: MFS transporter [Chloroflexi bacterium]|nr:MFS transporter [Chloroflexota bacterium]
MLASFRAGRVRRVRRARQRPEPRDAARVFLLISGGSSLLNGIVFTIAAVYYVTVARLDPLQLVLLGTTLEASYFLFEVPTGVFADTWSRRGSVIIGHFLAAAYFVVLGSFPIFGVMVLANVVSGLAYAFEEGALQAWLADEIGEERVGALYVRASQVGRILGLFGAVGGVALAATIGLGPTIVVAGLAQLGLALVLLIVMPEHGFRPAPRADGISRWRQMAATTRSGARAIRGRPLMLSILLAGALFGAFTEAFDRLWEAHVLTDIGLPPLSLPLLGDLPPIAWFAVFSVLAMPIELIVLEVVRRRVDMGNPQAIARVLLLVQAGLIVSVAAFGLAVGLALAMAAFFASGALRGVQHPLYDAWLNRGLEPSTRATVLSMAGQADAFGQFTGGPMLGGIGSTFGIRAALVAAAGFLLPTVLLYGRAVRHGGRVDDDEDVAIAE